MPPALRNHRAPTAGDTPAPTAASSLERPAAINTQNWCRSPRRATEGRPGDGNAPRPDRSERRFRTVIATSSPKVLRRPLEPKVYASVMERYPEARIIVPPRSTAVPSQTAETAPTQRDQHLQLIAKHGRMGWQKVSGYNRRALAEATIGRFKRVIGDGLRSRTEQRQATEMNVAVMVLNCMLELGRPESVRIA